MINILVTGCGGDIGQSIGKILKSWPMAGKVIGCDINSEHAAIFIYDKVIIVPTCNEDHYFKSINDIISSEGIDIIIPSSEPELRKLTLLDNPNPFGNCKIVFSNLNARKIGFDKLETANLLKKINVPYPLTFLLKDLDKPFLPMIIKSRDGSGSKSIFLAKSEMEFQFYKQLYPHFIGQEYLIDKDGEYTCGVYGNKSGELRTLIYKRKLIDSYSGYGIVIENKSIEFVLYKLANALKLNGSINAQLRITEKGPCIFEINPRFSSTVRFRNLMGFNDLIWSIEDILDLPLSPYNKPQTNTQFFKGFTEYIR